MFWFVFDTNKWRPDKEEVAELLGPDVAFRLIDSFESNSGHPLFMMFYVTYGLRSFNLGVIEAEAEKTEELPAAVLADARFTHIFGPLDYKDVVESEVRLSNYLLAESASEDVLSMISLLQGVRRKLAALGRLEKWHDPIEEIAECQGDLVEDLQHNRVHSIDYLFAPLHPVKTGRK